MYVVHGHCCPLGPHVGPHTSWDPVVGSHIFAGPDGRLVGLVGLVGSVVGFRFGGLDSSFVGAGGLGFFLPDRASSQYRSASSGGGEEEGLGHLIDCGVARVFHPDGTIFPSVDTTDDFPLYPGWVGYVDDRPGDQILGMVVLLLGTLGGVGLDRGAGRWRYWGGGEFGLFVTAERCVLALRAGLEGEPFFRTLF